MQQEQSFSFAGRALFAACLALLAAGCAQLANIGEPTHRYTLQMEAPEGDGANYEKQAAATLEVLRRRLEGLDIVTHSIERSGKRQIVIETSGARSAEQIKEVLNRGVEFELRMVDDQVSPFDLEEGIVPPGVDVLPMADGPSKVALRRVGRLKGALLSNAVVSKDQMSGQPVVNLTFNEKGARKLGQLTSENVGRTMAIVIDGKVHSAPIINEPVLGGEIQISGGFSQQSANELAIMLQSGALPVDVKMIEERELN